MPKTQPNPGAVAITSFLKEFVPAYAQRKITEAQTQAQEEQKQTPRDEIILKIAEEILKDPNASQQKIDWASKTIGIDNYPQQQRQSEIGGVPDYLYNQFPTDVKKDILEDTINPNTGSRYYTPDKRKQEADINLTKQREKTSKALEQSYKKRTQQYDSRDLNWLKAQQQNILQQLKLMVDTEGELFYKDDADEVDTLKGQLQAINETIRKKTGVSDPESELRNQANTILGDLEKKYPTYSKNAILQEFYKTDVGRQFQQQGMK